MSSDRWQRLEEVFEQVLDKPASERETFLEESCGDDRTLRRAVDSLLEADREGEAFLDHPLVPPPPSPAEESGDAPLPSGGQLGPYRLLRQVGRGGMSTVFLAARDDNVFQRRVAIKIIRQGMESEDSLRRLRIERQILASLDHPQIAQLFDGGTTAEGMPYFVMEYVQGLPIDVYCDQHRLTVDERIALFRKVCSAVHYAHQNLVVHRDLKPSNILVTADGDPKLLDFGIAKLLNPELSSSQIEPTATWLRLLTPQYASPEQVRGEAITTASDVYSLGILLYKLLTGRLPFQLAGRTPQEVERLLTDRDPPKPSTAVTAAPDSGVAGPEGAAGPTLEEVGRMRGSSPDQLARQLDGDLDNVVLMAMRSAPQRRYGSAEQLSEDLERYTRGFPVVARPGTLGYRLGKFVRRNRLAVSAAAIGLLLVLSFAVAMALQSARVASERDQARQERDEKEHLLALIGEIFELADPGEARGETFTVREALDRSAASLERRLASQPAMAAALRDTIGGIYLHLGLHAEARIHLAEALENRRAVYGAESLEVAESLGHLGAVYREMGDYPRAETLSAEAVSVVRRLVGDDHPALIGALNHQVTLLCYQGDYAAAREPSLEALTLARRYLDDTRSEMAEAVTNRAVVLKKTGDVEGAERLYREGLAMQRRILGEDHPEVANLLNNLAVVLKLRDQPEAAAHMHRRTLDLRRKLYGEKHTVVAQSLTNLAAVLRSQGKYPEAEDAYREALSILDESAGASHPLTIRVAVTLGSMLTESGRAQAAEGWLRSRLALWRSDLPERDGLLVWAQSALGEALLAQRRYDEATVLLEGSLAELEKRYGPEDPKTRKARQRVAALRDATGESAPAPERDPASPDPR